MSSTSTRPRRAGQSMVVVRFKVGEAEEAALVRLNQKLAANADRIPPGVVGPIVKPRSIDDVPILAVTVWSARYGDDQLRALAAQLRDAIAEVTDVSEVTLIGGRPRQLRVDVDPARLAAYGLDPLAVQRAIGATNARGTASGPVAGGQITGLEAGSRLRTADEVRRVVVSAASGRPVLVGDLAEVVDGDAEPTSYVTYQSREAGAHPAVTIAVAKRKGTNAIDVAHHVTQKLDTLKGTLVPVRRAPHDHPRLRRDRRREEQRTAVAHAARGALGVGAHLARARPARGGGGAHRDSGHARADAVHVLPLRLHAQPHHALRPDLLHRHPGGRRDRGGGEHRAACAAAHRRVERAGRRGAARRGRGGQPHHPGHARRGGGDSADGVRRRPDGPVHAADSGRRVGGDGLLARRRLRRDAVGGGAAPEAGRPSRPRRRGSASRVSIGA